jgi:lipoate---protein ligase
MIYVDNENITDPRINLAIEEHLLRTKEQTILLFYINAPSIIVGRNQNTMEEINYPYVQEHGVHVVRRLSGGGAVYQDLGNLNFSFITRDEPGSFQNFAKFTRPVTDVLHDLGVPAELSGRNDILVNGRKVSGNAQYRRGERMFSHGTLLFDTKLEDVVAALNVSQSKITSKGLKSVRSRVANITEFLDEPLDILTFKRRILQGVFDRESDFPSYKLTEDDWAEIHEISEQRYANWDWNYGRSPKFNVRKTHRFPIGEVDVCIDVERGEIEHLKIYGDFLGEGEVSDIEAQLEGVRYDQAPVEAALAGMDISPYFGGLTTAEFVALLF